MNVIGITADFSIRIPHSVDEVRTDDDLKNVINLDGLFQFKRLPILHKLRSKVFYKVDVSKTY